MDDESNDQWTWFALYGGIYVSFYFFTSPFVGNPELLTTWTPYVYLSMGIYGWLIGAAAIHTPVHQLGLLESTIKQPISLLFPFFSVSFVILILLEMLMVLIIPRATSCFGMSWKTTNVTLTRSFANVIRNSAALSIACVALILHCDPATESSAGRTYNQHACEQLFRQAGSNAQFVPASYRGAMVIWIVGMALAITNFVLERLSGIQVISFHWIADSEDFDSEDHIHETLPAVHRLPMVPWYSMFLFDTAFQLLISLKVFLGRFDYRSLQHALYPSMDTYVFDHLADRDELWFDFMADCGDGFNSSYHIARLLAQPQLDVEGPLDLFESDGAWNSSSKRKGKKMKLVKRTFPRGEALIIGGDLAYPHPDSESYESRLWRCFEYAMKPPQSYDPIAISTGKPVLPVPCKSLKEYEGPTAFAIPGNHDWFDGLNTFTRFICHRDWLGGWLLPQKTSHFCLKLPHHWWLFGLDLALESDINTEQFAVFEQIVTRCMGENDRVIVVTHEPRWILDSYEQHDATEEKLSYLVEHVLKGRVVVRLAGDIHNYTRHSNERDRKPAEPNRPDKMHQPPAPPRSLRDRGRRNSGISISLAQRALSPTRKHFPHMYQHEGFKAAADTSGGRGHRLHGSAQQPPVQGAQHLIVSGGGGAWTCEMPGSLRESNDEGQFSVVYRRRYALLNVVGFRRINWRFDVIGGVGYFFLVFSMFPRCNVRYIVSSSDWLTTAKIFASELRDVHCEMLSSSYVSFATCVVMFVTVTTFADCPELWQKITTGAIMSTLHCLAAASILLTFECIFEVATARGSLGHEGEHSLFQYFNASFPELSAVTDYDVFSLTQVFVEAMKFFMTVFDVPEMVAIRRIKICSSAEESVANLSRLEQWQYYFSVLPYFWVLATPVVGVVFGGYLYVALNVFGRHYNEAFSALRIASYKNFLRLHVTPTGDLEILAFGVDKMPSKWCRDPRWSGGSHAKGESHLPSFRWTRPSYWQPVVTRVGNMLRMDFENPELDTRFNTTDRSNVRLIDRVVIRGARHEQQPQQAE